MDLVLFIYPIDTFKMMLLWTSLADVHLFLQALNSNFSQIQILEPVVFCNLKKSQYLNKPFSREDQCNAPEVCSLPKEQTPSNFPSWCSMTTVAADGHTHTVFAMTVTLQHSPYCCMWAVRPSASQRCHSYVHLSPTRNAYCCQRHCRRSAPVSIAPHLCHSAVGETVGRKRRLFTYTAHAPVHTEPTRDTGFSQHKKLFQRVSSGRCAWHDDVTPTPH